MAGCIFVYISSWLVGISAVTLFIGAVVVWWNQREARKFQSDFDPKSPREDLTNSIKHSTFGDMLQYLFVFEFFLSLSYLSSVLGVNELEEACFVLGLFQTLNDIFLALWTASMSIELFMIFVYTGSLRAAKRQRVYRWVL